MRTPPHRPGRLAVPTLAALALLVAACGGQYQQGLGHHANAGSMANLATASLSQALTRCAGSHGTLLGADVSVYQGTIDWSQASKTLKWAYAKATEGTGFRDVQFARNWQQMKAYGVPRGAYHFFHPSESGKAQADFYLQVVGHLTSSDLPPMLDWEVNDKVSLSTGVANAEAFIREIRARTGRQTIIYTSPGLWPKMSNRSFGSTPLWDAAWTYDRTGCPVLPSGWSNWVYWQWSNKGAVPGISGHVDMDVFNGDKAQLAALGGVSAPKPKPPSGGGSGGGTTAPKKGLLEGIIYASPHATRGLSGAKVTVDGHTLYTDGQGFYQIRIPAGTYTITASHPGYQTGHRRRQVVARSTAWGSIGLVATVTYGHLKGVVYRSPSAANRLSGARVALSDGKVTTTDSQGRFSFDVKPGTYLISASRSGYVTNAIRRTVRLGQTSFGGIGLHRKSYKPAIIKGAVYLYPNPAHRIAGARVTLANGATVVTGSNGYFQFSVPAGNWQVTVTKAGYRTGRRLRTASAGKVVWASVGLVKGHTSMTGTVVGVVYENGHPGHRIGFARVRTSTGQTAIADAHGVFKIAGVPVGAVIISASAPGYQPGESKRTVSGGHTIWGSVALSKGGSTGGPGGIVNAVLVTPAEGATTGSNPTFVWKNVTSAQMHGKHFSYYVELYQHNDVGFHEFSVAAGTGAQTSMNFKLNLAKGIWEWRVEAVPDGVNPQAGGTMHAFTVK